MSKHLELLRQRASVLDVAEAMVATAVGDNRGLTDEEQRQVEGYKAQAAKLEQQAKLVEEIGSMRSTATAGPVQAPMLNTKTKPGDDETKAMAYYLRTADASAIREQRASNNTGMNYTTAADGGNAVPTGHYGQIIARRDELMLADRLGVRRIAGVGTTVNVPLDAEADGEFVTKAEQADDNSTGNFDRDAPALGTAAMTLVKYTKKIELTDELLQDEDSNLLAFVEQFVGRGMAKTHNDLLVTEALAGGTAALTFDSASTIGAGEIPELWYLLPDYYATDEASVGWIMRRATEGVIRGLVGTTNFYYAPTPGGTTTMGRPMLWGAPLYNSGKVAAVAASAKSVILGNFFYMGLREAPTLTVLRDPYTVDGKVILKYYFRAVYKTLQAAAIIYGTHPTA
jgi:HK97 family phage major capsid protein